jgi:cullin-associated NEDD8-dissociated protein 1
MPYELLPRFIDSLTNLATPKSQDQSIAPTATRYLVISLPRPVAGVASSQAVVETFDAVSRMLIPRLIGQVVLPFDNKGRKQPSIHTAILAVDPKRGANMDAIDLCSETIRCFGPLLREQENAALLKKLLEIIEGEPTGVVAKKKAVSAVSLLALYISNSLLSTFVSNIIESLRMPHLPAVRRRLLIMLVGSVAHSIPRRFGQYLSTIAPFVLSALSKDEYDQLLEDRDEEGSVSSHAEEVKEAALVTLEDCLASCVNEMRPFTDEAMEASIRYLSYDPAVVMDSDDEADAMEDDGDDFVDEEDYEQEVALSDSEDSSWKIRRCAVKALTALITTRAPDLMESNVLYDRIAPFLIKRFNEREENVRLEILSTMTLVLQRTSQVTFDSGEVVIDESMLPPSPTLTHSRKRRRGESNASATDISFLIGAASPGQSPSPISGPKAEIGKLGPSMIQAAVKLFGQKDLSTKLSVISLLTEYAHLRHGGLSDHLSQLVQPTVNMIKSDGGAKGVTSSLGNNLRIEALRFLLAICETHSSKVVAPFLESIVPVVILPIQDKYFKIACHALQASEGVIKVLTPPRTLANDGKNGPHVKAFFDAISSKARANDTDLEVRKHAIHALGVLCVRTSSTPTLLSPSDRTTAFAILEERLGNETTRQASVEAIDAIVTFADDKTTVQPEWIQKVAIELSHQLRKADIRLRNSSIIALRKISTNPVTNKGFDEATIVSLTTTLTGLLDSVNVGGLTAACVILTALVEKAPTKVVTPALNNAICAVLSSSIAGSAFERLKELLEIIGEQGVGKNLMQDLLKKVGVGGDSTIVGSAIGTLMVSGGSSVGVEVSDILKELESAADDQRKCLALCVLGEVGLRRGRSSSLEPQTFLEYFKLTSDVVPRVAAISLGRAGAGNPPTYFPVIMTTLKTADQAQPLLLHSVKEILQNSSKSKADAEYADAIWDDIIKISSSEENRTVGAECIGRLLVLNPAKYIESLQVSSYLESQTIAHITIGIPSWARSANSWACDSGHKIRTGRS